MLAMLQVLRVRLRSMARTYPVNVYAFTVNCCRGMRGRESVSWREKRLGGSRFYLLRLARAALNVNGTAAVCPSAGVGVACAPCRSENRNGLRDGITTGL